MQTNSGVKQLLATEVFEDSQMRKQTPTTSENLRANIKHLMALHGDDTVSLARKSGIPQRTVYNILYTNQKASIEQAEKLGKAYGFSGWQIIMPNLQGNPATLNKVMEGYLSADAVDREIIERLTSRHNGTE